MHKLAVIGDVVSGIAVLGWLLSSYETHVGAVVTTMAGIYYLFMFMRWLTNGDD